jgi:hypothetical protein
MVDRIFKVKAEDKRAVATQNILEHHSVARFKNPYWEQAPGKQHGI